MNEFREQLIDRMIAIYGMENEIVINFCNLCEKLDDYYWNDECLAIMVRAHEDAQVFKIEDDD